MSNSRQHQIDRDIKCSCKGYNLDKMLQPNILTLLAKESLHGYLIIKELENKNLFNGEKADNTGIYRALKTLEARKLVRSQWNVDGAGAAKKIYSITYAGIGCLQNWAITLEEYSQMINTVVADAKSALANLNNKKTL